MELEVKTRNGDNSGTIDLPDSVFNVTSRKHLLHQGVRVYLANQRQGTSSTKTRSEVRAGGRKPWRQKGLGRARSGTAASPIWVGGGIAHGPRPRDYTMALPRKARRLAVRAALSTKAADGQVVVVESLGVNEPKTKRALELMRALGIEGRKCLFVFAARDENMIRATGNIPGVRIVIAKDINIHDVMNTQVVVIDKDAVGAIAEVLGH
jgi:large subunit ribosomal protein L4